MDRAMLKVLTEKEVKNHDKGFSEDIKKYFAASVADAEQLISPAGSEEKDSRMIDSDSDGTTLER